ncbi:FGGY-family carbohydrate kinase [Salipiger bermudensis]|uniref:FGGY-family carbohydrate kinase n=1 Tax=Salipiger bermudensis TaxID=344736 RepID=UPI001C99F719|nr:FGGY-family carbohydrate kinase [Salipiger bermudensis]MBY6006221.1 FGGY-family carbohydrate kinase [Salipiger bermudensis]
MKIAVLDIGKTNVKLALVDTASMTEIAVVTRPNRVLSGQPYPHFDIDGIWAFFLDGLRRMQAEHGVDEISVTTHGACFVLLDAGGGLAAPVLDYEHDGPDALAQAYDSLRQPFEDTGAPRLPMGLNAGAQLHWLVQSFPELTARTAQVVSYPQYWSGRLTGHFATEPTSLGCHTDLWLPREGRFSDLPERLGLTMAPLAAANDVAGTITSEIAAMTGLAPHTPVRSGIHDSNASLLPYLHRMEGAFSVVSTGTWVICMSVEGDEVALDPLRDTLMNVNALGNPVPSARFMGGREYERMRPQTVAPTRADIDRVLAQGKALYPAIETASGPFGGCAGGWSDEAMTPGEKGAALSLYLALMTATCLDLIGARGPVIVEGPFARNELYLDMLTVRTGRPVLVSNTATGTSLGAALLCAPDADLGVSLTERRPPEENAARLSSYGSRWYSAVTERNIALVL